MIDPKFITDWRELQIDVPYWMICRADPEDRDIVIVTSKNETDPRSHAMAKLFEGGALHRFRENTHVFVEVQQAPSIPRELEYFPAD